MAISGRVKAGFAVGAVALVVILAISVVTLVKVFNIKNDSSSSDTVIQPTVTPEVIASTTNNPGDANITGTPDVTGSPTNNPGGVNIYPEPVSNTKPYQDAARYFLNSIDVSVNPCDDFYRYACGKYNDSLSFYVADNANYHIMANGFGTSNPKDSYPVQQVKTMYAQCLKDNQNWSSLTANGTIIKNKVSAFKGATNFGFPFIDGSTGDWPDAKGLGTALGYLSGVEGIDTLISAFVDTNWRDPTGPMPYLLFIDQSVLTLPWTYYIGKTWDITKVSLHDRIQGVLTGYAQIMNANFQNDTLEGDIQDILNFEYLLANNYSSTDTDRLQSTRSYNLITPSVFTNTYKNIDIVSYLTQLTSNNQNATTLVGKTTFQFSLAEKDRLSQINDAIKSSFGGQVTTRTFYNYLNYRLLYTYSGYFPAPPEADSFLDRYQAQRFPRGRSKFIRSRRPKDLGKDADEQTILGCVDDTVFSFQYANARVFIDQIYPTSTSRDLIRENVRKVVDGILIGMQSMIDQLSWMSPSSKQGAYQKIQNLVRNYAFPDFIADDARLTRYYKGIKDFTNKNYYQIMTFIQQFNSKKTFDLLLRTRGVARDDWNGPPGTVNAWYQPELNSITFPAAILRQPYFDSDWPASVNYGAMGVVAGHELTHSFDSSGTQWDGVGTLFGWLDDPSQASFNNMTQCVINEYNNFCPLNSSYSPSCINGFQTQGENVADNGGIHAAYRAYRNAINFDGSDPLLPGNPVSAFTHDQLFFLSFAQVWCQLPSPAADTYRQLLVDPHSPSKYRVLGTIQNYPGFRNAFNCPVGSSSSPKNYCNVWISDINITNAKSGPESLNVLNIPAPALIKEDNVQYTKYSQAQQFFKYSVNTSSDPCNDFYNYACGSYKNPLSFTVYRNKNYNLMVQGFEKILAPGYNGDLIASSAVNKTVQFYSACKEVISNLSSYTKDGKFVKSILDDFANFTGWKFNWFDSSIKIDKLDRTTLAKAIAFLSVNYGVDTFVTPFIDVNPIDDKNFTGFVLYYDQSTFLYQDSYYLPGAWDITLPKYQKNAITLLTNYGNSIGATFDALQVQQSIDIMLDFERTIANDPYVANDTIRRDFTTLWNPTDIATLQANGVSIDWATYTQQLADLSGVKFIPGDVSNYKVSVMEPNGTGQLEKYLSNIDANTVVQYLFFRLLSSQSSFVFDPSADSKTSFIRLYPQDGLSYRIGKPQPKPDPFDNKAVDIGQAEVSCAIQSMNYLQYANARIFTEYLYPHEDARTAIRTETNKVMVAIKNAMQNMLNELDWLDEKSRVGAGEKIQDLQVNIAYPDFILNDTTLDEYYSTLSFTTSDDYFSMVKKLIVFNRYMVFVNLTQTTPNRNDFLGPPGTVNAWYQPELNSITIPEGILQQPYFDPDWPASIKFGALGVILGHELGHGFDDQGIQWTGKGKLSTWMSDGSYAAFKGMAKCVIDEYSSFKPLNDSYNPSHLNGVNTQGENIADNGGIHSGWRSYRNWIALNGPDPQLPDRVLSQFTHDQLFFLSFAQVWCQLPPTPDAIYQQILVDPHSPSLYRVFGTIQNFPAFRTSFNCPLNSTYAPEKYCHVWVP